LECGALTTSSTGSIIPLGTWPETSIVVGLIGLAFIVNWSSGSAEICFFIG